MYIRPFFRWYDLWIGAYIDRENRTAYICPLPMIGIKISLKKRKKKMVQRLSGELRPESYRVGDRVQFVENISKYDETDGIFGTVSKRYMNTVGWIIIEVTDDGGTIHKFEWHNINGIRKAKTVAVYVDADEQ